VDRGLHVDPMETAKQFNIILNRSLYWGKL